MSVFKVLSKMRGLFYDCQFYSHSHCPFSFSFAFAFAFSVWNSFALTVAFLIRSACRVEILKNFDGFLCLPHAVSLWHRAWVCLGWIMLIAKLELACKGFLCVRCIKIYRLSVYMTVAYVNWLWLTVKPRAVPWQAGSQGGSEVGGANVQHLS